MAMNSNAWGDRIAAAIKGFGITAGTPITDGQLQQIWRLVKSEDQTEIDENVDINLDLGDIVSDVPALGILDSTTNPCTGQATGQNQAIVLEGKLE